MKDFEDAMLDVAWNNLDAMVKRYSASDTKAFGIISLCGIFVSFMIAIVLNGNMVPFTMGLFLLTAITFIFSVIFCIASIYPRKINDLSTDKLIDDLFNKKPEHQIRGIITTIGGVEDSWRKVCAKKALWLIRASYALGIGVLTLIFGFFSLIFL